MPTKYLRTSKIYTRDPLTNYTDPQNQPDHRKAIALLIEYPHARLFRHDDKNAWFSTGRFLLCCGLLGDEKRPVYAALSAHLIATGDERECNRLLLMCAKTYLAYRRFLLVESEVAG